MAEIRKRTNLQRKRSFKKRFPGVVFFGWAKSDKTEDELQAIRSLYLIIQTSEEKISAVVGKIREYHQPILEESELFDDKTKIDLKQGHQGYVFSFYSCESVKGPKASFPSNVFRGLVKADRGLVLKSGDSLQKYALRKIEDYLL